MFEVILYQPEIPPNTGNIIRLCANSGSRLHLIEPLGFNLEQRELRRAGLDYADLATVRVHHTLHDCLVSLNLQTLSASARLFAVETGGTRRYSDVSFQAGDALLFGPETRGLPADVLVQLAATHVLTIPMRAGNRSLNLANAVSLVVYEAWRQLGFAHP
jgi:tRNA (cytidine/uridine-2'-O-)-methyltransferase